MSEVWISAAVGILTGIGGWFVGRRKQNAEVTGAEYENFKKFVDANREIIADMKQQIVDLIEKNGELRNKVEHLEEELQKIKRQYPCENCPNQR